MAQRWGVAALLSGVLVLSGSGLLARAADDKPAGDGKGQSVEKPANGHNGNGSNGNGNGKNGKNGHGHSGATVHTRPVPRGGEGRITVHLPTAEARLWVDDTLTRQYGQERSFRSQASDREKTYSYTMRAEWTGADGHLVQRKVRVSFHGGEDVTVDFR